MSVADIHYKTFVKQMEGLSRKHDPGSIFDDFLTMSICCFHKINIRSQLREKDTENEKRYLEVTGRYSREELDTYARLLGLLQFHFIEHPYSDLLGKYFTEHITRGKNNGQYFTPEHICDLMGRLYGTPGTIKEKSIFDPACGSGRLLLSFAKANPQNHFFGADNAVTCAKMTTLNLFLNGLTGEVSWMDSLSADNWYGGWHINNGTPGIVPITGEQSLIRYRPVLGSTPENDPERGTQLILF